MNRTPTWRFSRPERAGGRRDKSNATGDWLRWLTLSLVHHRAQVMAYELHIERLPVNDKGEATPIPLDNWRAAVSATEGVRLCPPGARMITNPATKEVISIPTRDGDTEVYFPDDRSWHAVFRWFEGEASFNAKFEPGDSSHPVWSAAVTLASRLGAVIRGDEGEIYDLKTGEVTDA